VHLPRRPVPDLVALQPLLLGSGSDSGSGSGTSGSIIGTGGDEDWSRDAGSVGGDDDEGSVGVACVDDVGCCTASVSGPSAACNLSSVSSEVTRELYSVATGGGVEFSVGATASSEGVTTETVAPSLDTVEEVKRASMSTAPQSTFGSGTNAGQPFFSSSTSFRSISFVLLAGRSSLGDILHELFTPLSAPSLVRLPNFSSVLRAKISTEVLHRFSKASFISDSFAFLENHSSLRAEVSGMK